MRVDSAITDHGFREYVRNQVPRLAGVAPIVRAMEKHGLVGPANGAKDREVLISPI